MTNLRLLRNLFSAANKPAVLRFCDSFAAHDHTRRAHPLVILFNLALMQFLSH